MTPVAMAEPLPPARPSTVASAVEAAMQRIPTGEKGQWTAARSALTPKGSSSPRAIFSWWAKPPQRVQTSMRVVPAVFQATHSGHRVAPQVPQRQPAYSAWCFPHFSRTLDRMPQRRSQFWFSAGSDSSSPGRSARRSALFGG